MKGTGRQKWIGVTVAAALLLATGLYLRSQRAEGTAGAPTPDAAAGSRRLDEAERIANSVRYALSAVRPAVDFHRREDARLDAAESVRRNLQVLDMSLEGLETFLTAQATDRDDEALDRLRASERWYPPAAVDSAAASLREWSDNAWLASAQRR